MRELKIYKESHLENTIQFAIDNPKVTPQQVMEFNTKKCIKLRGCLYLSDEHDILG